MIRIQNVGLLKDILREAGVRGNYTVPWIEFEEHLALMKIRATSEVAREWAVANLLWVSFEYDGIGPDRKITHVTFSAYK